MRATPPRNRRYRSPAGIVRPQAQVRLLSLHRLAAVLRDKPTERVRDKPSPVVLMQVAVGLGAHATGRRRIIRCCAERYHRGCRVTTSQATPSQSWYRRWKVGKARGCDRCQAKTNRGAIRNSYVVRAFSLKETVSMRRSSAGSARIERVSRHRDPLTGRYEVEHIETVR